MGRYTADAARFHGRAGALALAMGIGAAVAGGAGLAHADGSTDPDAGGARHAQSASRPAAVNVGPRASSTARSSGQRSRGPASVTAPALLGDSRGATNRLQATARPATADRLTPVLRHTSSSSSTATAPTRDTQSPGAGNADSPVAPMPIMVAVLHMIGREIERICGNHVPSTESFTTAEAYANANPAGTAELPGRADEVHTAYGDIGKWMLRADQQIANYGGQQYGGRSLLEPVNVIIVDSGATTATQATRKLNAAMFWAGFPAQLIHSTGFQSEIDDVMYGQQPSGPLAGYSDNFFVLPNNHGRIFGPDPVETSSGYVWSGAFSTETFGLYNFLPAHTYVSSDMARTALAIRLIRSGQATFVGMVPLDNSYNTGSTTTGDHDGYAVVLQLK